MPERAAERAAVERLRERLAGAAQAGPQNRIWRFGDGIDTDAMAPGQYMKLPIEELARHCLEGVRPEFAASVRPGDVIVAGANFGVGSSREQAPQALATLGVAGVVAVSFAGLFYRNAINLGLPVLVCGRHRLTRGRHRRRAGRLRGEADAGGRRNDRPGTDAPLPAGHRPGGRADPAPQGNAGPGMIPPCSLPSRRSRKIVSSTDASSSARSECTSSPRR